MGVGIFSVVLVSLRSVDILISARLAVIIFRHKISSRSFRERGPSDMRRLFVRGVNVGLDSMGGRALLKLPGIRFSYLQIDSLLEMVGLRCFRVPTGRQTVEAIVDL